MSIQTDLAAVLAPDLHEYICFACPGTLKELPGEGLDSFMERVVMAHWECFRVEKGEGA